MRRNFATVPPRNNRGVWRHCYHPTSIDNNSYQCCRIWQNRGVTTMIVAYRNYWPLEMAVRRIRILLLYLFLSIFFMKIIKGINYNVCLLLS